MSDYLLPLRLSDPDAESAHPWLVALIDVNHPIGPGGA